MSAAPPATAADTVAAGSLAPAPGGAAALLALLEPVLQRAAGAGAQPVSLQLDLASPAGDAQLELSARLERATRTLVFATAEARRADGVLAATVTAIFKRG